jgi:hypothetical protein
MVDPLVCGCWFDPKAWFLVPRRPLVAGRHLPYIDHPTFCSTDTLKRNMRESTRAWGIVLLFDTTVNADRKAASTR